MSESKTGSGFPGQSGLSAGTSDYNNTTFLVEQMLALTRIATIVQVKKCTNSGGVTAVGFVDVTPLVNMTDGLGKGSEHGVIYGLPYSRLQGGKNAIICDPVVGDIGMALIADRDISVVKKTKKRGNPGSRRRNDLADGVYLFGILNAVPTQYVRFLLDGDGEPNGLEIVDKFGNKIEMLTTGIKMTDKTGHIIDMNETEIAITGDVNITGKLSSSDQSNLAGGSKKVVLDGDPVSGGVVHASSTKTKGT